MTEREEQALALREAAELKRRQREERRARVLALAAQGLSVREVSLAAGVSAGFASKVLHENGHRPRRCVGLPLGLPC